MIQELNGRYIVMCHECERTILLNTNYDELLTSMILGGWYFDGQGDTCCGLCD